MKLLVTALLTLTLFSIPKAEATLLPPPPIVASCLTGGPMAGFCMGGVIVVSLAWAKFGPKIVIQQKSPPPLPMDSSESYENSGDRELDPDSIEAELIRNYKAQLYEDEDAWSEAQPKSGWLFSLRGLVQEKRNYYAGKFYATQEECEQTRQIVIYTRTKRFLENDSSKTVWKNRAFFISHYKLMQILSPGPAQAASGNIPAWDYNLDPSHYIAIESFSPHTYVSMEFEDFDPMNIDYDDPLKEDIRIINTICMPLM